MTSTPVATQASQRTRWLAAAAVAISGAGLFHFFGNATQGYIKTTSLFWWWIRQWLDPRAETEHGWLILGISAWVWWRNLRIANRGLRIADLPRQEAGDGKLETRKSRLEFHPELPPASESCVSAETANSQSAIRDSQSIAPALAALLAGLALHAMGFVAQQTRVSIVAFLIFAWGAVTLAGGRRGGRAAVFPLMFLLFAIPISVLDEIGLPLRLWVTTAGEAIARHAGIDLVRSGTQLIAPDGRFNYDVAAPCSGVRSLVALTALAVLVGYLNFRSWWRRVLVLGLCFPLVYLGNVARIVAIVFAAQAGGPGWGDRAHEVMGYGVFVIVLGGLLLVVAAVHRWLPETPGASAPSRESSGNEATRRLSLYGTVGVGAVIILLTGAEMIFLSRVAEMAPRGGVGVVLAADGLNPVELPAFLGTEWIGQRTEVTAVEREILPADTGFSRKNYAFVADRTRDVFLSIVLSGRDRTSIHRPELCLVGQGWTIDGTTQRLFRVPPAATASTGGGGEFRATVLRVRREIPSAKGKIVVPQLVVYWFVGSDGAVPSSWERFKQDIWNRITRARADRWAYVLMQTDAREGEAAALARMQSVLDGTLPAFQRPATAR